MKYILEEHPKIIEYFKKHFYLRSIAEAFSKILVFSNEELIQEKYIDERLELLGDLFDMLKEDQDPEVRIVAFLLLICN